MLLALNSKVALFVVVSFNSLFDRISRRQGVSSKASEEFMRVAYLINQYPKVSHSFIRREILALERAGHDVTRIALRGWDGDLADDEDIVERARTQYVLRSGVFPLVLAFLRTVISRPARVLKALELAWRMARRADRPLPFHLIYLAEACRMLPWLDDARVEHLHAHFGTNSAEVAMLVHALDGPEWSFTVHGPEEFDKPEFIGLAEKIRHCAFVVAISSYGRSQLYRLVDHSLWSKVHVIHCGLERDYFEGPSSAPPPAPRLVCVGRLCEQKGQLLLLEAARRLASNGAKFELVLVGDGEMRADINNFIASHKLESFIRITGWISGQQVREEIRAARALVLPSFAEGLPVVIMEAMALKRPVISTFVAGIPELVHSGEHGWLIPAGDVDQLTNAMSDCLNAPAERLAAMGQAAHTRVFERHNIDVEASRLAELFKAQRALG
jgi:colanic acid/amylovoran biosynthesis glycosyltransferase